MQQYCERVEGLWLLEFGAARDLLLVDDRLSELGLAQRGHLVELNNTNNNLQPDMSHYGATLRKLV